MGDSGEDMFSAAIQHIENIMANLPDAEADPVYESFFHSIPIPCWIKVYENWNHSFRMLSLNNAYLKKYGVELREYVGKLDSEIWAPDIAERFRQHDLVVLNEGSAEYCIEETQEEKILVLKFPFGVGGLPAVAGLVLGILP